LRPNSDEKYKEVEIDGRKVLVSIE